MVQVDFENAMVLNRFFQGGQLELIFSCKTDAPGSFIAWLTGKRSVHAYLMPGSRVDVGTIDGYNGIRNAYGGITIRT